MKIEGFWADADLVGRRVRIGWELVPEATESFDDIPRLRLLAKRHDFDFPAGDSAFVVYDSDTFPAAHEIPLSARRIGGEVTSYVVETVSAEPDAGSGRVEAIRRSRWTTVDDTGRLVRRQEEILDIGGGAGLAPGEPRYFELRRPGDPAPGPITSLRAIATPGQAYGIGRQLYDLLPAVYRRHDVVARSGGPIPSIGAGDIPEAQGAGGQLRRFLDIAGVAADRLRSRAEQLRDLHDIAEGDARFLPLLAATIGWELDPAEDIPVQRHEVRHAATLYRLTGTSLGARLWIKRLTGWEAEVREMWRNVFVSNDIGSGLAGDRGSRTVDTSDPDLLASRGGLDDGLDYTQDSGPAPDRRYALDTIAIFPTLDAEQLSDAGAVLQSRDKLVTNATLFLPLNMRAVVVLDLPSDDIDGAAVTGVTASTDS